MKKGIIIKSTMLVFFFITSCSNKKVDTDKFLPVEVMQKTVFQLMEVDEFLSRQIQTDTAVQPQVIKAKYYQQVFNLNKVDRVRFYATMRYMEKHPDAYKILVDSLEALSKREKLILIKH